MTIVVEEEVERRSRKTDQNKIIKQAKFAHSLLRKLTKTANSKIKS